MAEFAARQRHTHMPTAGLVDLGGGAGRRRETQVAAGECLLASTELCEQLGLSPLRARVGRFRIERQAQQPFAFGKRRSKLRVAGNVDQFFRISIKVEELRRCPDVVAVLPLAEAQHERAREGADRVILGNDRPGPLSLKLKQAYWRKHEEGWHRTPVRPLDAMAAE